MKSFIKIAFASALLVCSNSLFAQKTETGCNDLDIKDQAEGYKKSFIKDGMSLFQEAMIHMTSLEPTPIEVKLTQGIQYQFIFVASEHANKLVMEIYDGKDKMIDQKKERGANNYIIYPFTPSKTDIYLITLMQKKGTRDMCGYFGVMMKGYKVPAAVIKRENNVVEKPVQRPILKPVERVVEQPTSKPETKQENNTNTKHYRALPANQRPNPNRTRATNEALQEKN